VADPTLDRAALVAARRRFYDAVERGDLDAMAQLWKPGEDTVCVHPGFGQLRGTATILRSFALLMAQASYVQYVLTEEVVDLHGDTAVLGCTENMMVAGHDEPVQGFDSWRAVATSVFVRTEGAWRLVVHHASVLGEEWRPWEEVRT
jgi:ketosteroid isomerase-like protein